MKTASLRVLPLLVGASLPLLVAHAAPTGPPAGVSKAASPVAKTLAAKAPATKAPVAKPAASPWTIPLQGDQKIAHVLNRLSFGPRPGDIERVRAMGLDRWIDAQMHPQSLDDSPVETQIATLPFLNAPVERLMLAYEGDQGALRKLLQGRDPKAKGQLVANTPADPMMPGAIPNAAMPADEMRADGTTGDAMANMTPRQRRAARAQATAQATGQAVYKRRQDAMMQMYQQSGMEPRSSIQAVGELSAAKLARAVDSNRQLNEVLVDFWGNHFNVDVHKAQVRAMKIVDDREVIRPHIWGSFRELLGATAKSPAMLVYLDNARSTATMTDRGGKTRGGLNENYARELMELHTLGVDGGYTQADVTEVARCLTGWSVGNALLGENGFQFNARNHDNGEKHVLGITIPAGGGQHDGEQVLDILASSPATAKFIARKLCVRFVADTPPDSLIQKVTDSFLRSKGDLPTVYRTLFTAPEFTSQGAYHAKIKSPFEFAVSSVRALDGHFVVPDANNPRQRQWLIALGAASAQKGSNGPASKLPRRPLGTEVAQMGQPLWACQPPTGYSENSATWVSSSALVARLNFSLSLTQGRIGDVLLQQDTFRPTTVDALARDLLAGDMSAGTRQTLDAEVKESPNDGAKMRALVLGSPEFQRR